MVNHKEINLETIRLANAKFHTTNKTKYNADKLNHEIPWELWEFCDTQFGNEFSPCEQEPLWWEHYQYRHKDPQGEPLPLQSYGKMLVILRKNDDGDYEGWVENSYSLNWQKNFCYVYTTNTMYSFLGSHTLDAVVDVNKQLQRFVQQLKTTPQYLDIERRVSKMRNTIQKCKDVEKRTKLLQSINNILPNHLDSVKNWEVYDPTSEDCPVTVALHSWTLARSNRNSRNFSKRNAAFKRKDT